MKKISYSQLSLYNECPYHWKLRYIDKIRTMESNIYLIFGSAMHTTLQIYLDKMYDESIKSADKINLEKILQEELINEFKEASYNGYEVVWNASNMSSGVYFVKLHAGNTVQTQKIMLIK